MLHQRTKTLALWQKRGTLFVLLITIIDGKIGRFVPSGLTNGSTVYTLPYVAISCIFHSDNNQNPVYALVRWRYL